jgi:2-dehydropantoate 2-reductase
MRILVIGAGALGGYVGACLTRAGRDVTFLVRPRRAKQLACDGLHIVSPQGEFSVPATAITADDLRGPFDLVVVTVKSYSLQDAMDQFAPAVGPSTVILPLLNGMTHLDGLTARFGAEPVLGGLARISAARDCEGRIVNFGGGELVFGELAGGSSVRIRALSAVFEGGQFGSLASDDILQEMWEKWVQAATGASMNCMMRATIGDIVAVPEGRDVILRLFDECCAIATAAGHPPRRRFVEICKALLTEAGSPLKWSMLRDIERGLATEGDHVIGELIARATNLGVSAPTLNLARIHLAIYESGRTRMASGG